MWHLVFAVWKCLPKPLLFHLKNKNTVCGELINKRYLERIWWKKNDLTLRVWCTESIVVLVQLFFFSRTKQSTEQMRNNNNYIENLLKIMHEDLCGGAVIHSTLILFEYNSVSFWTFELFDYIYSNWFIDLLRMIFSWRYFLIDSQYSQYLFNFPDFFFLNW